MKNMLYAVLVRGFWLISLFSIPLLRRLGRLVGRLAWLMGAQSRRVTETNLAICFPEMAVDERTVLAKTHLQHLGMLAMELGYVWLRPPQQLLSRVSEVHGQAHLDAALAAGKGVVILAPHTGNWEVVGLYLGYHYSITSMFQPPDNPALNAMIYRARSRCGATLVPTSVAGVKSLLKALKRGGLVGVLPDQVPPPQSGEFAPFFATPALTATMTFNLIQRTGARAVVAYARRVPGGNDFHMVFEPVSEALYSDDCVTSLSALNQAVENCVLNAPEQYQWEYKRFKKQPAGGKKYYR